MRSRNKIYNENGVFFITSTTVDWLDLFNTKDTFQILIDSINFNVSERNLKVHAYVLMKNHFHLICTGENLSKIINSIKSYSARKFVEKFQTENDILTLNKLRKNKKNFKTDREFQFWQEGFYPKEMLNTEILNQKIEYIHANPVRKGYCENNCDWEYSSARFYEKDIEGDIKVIKTL